MVLCDKGPQLTVGLGALDLGRYGSRVFHLTWLEEPVWELLAHRKTWPETTYSTLLNILESSSMEI